MTLISRRSLLTAAAALTLPSAGVVLTKIGKEPTHLPRPKHPALLYPTRQPAQVNIFNRSKLPLGVSPGPFVAAMQRYVNEFLVPIWGCPAVLRWTENPVPGAMNLVFTDENDEKGSIAYHDWNPQLMATPYGEISVIEGYESGYGLGLSFSHELGEMLVNPGVSNWASVGHWVAQKGLTPATNTTMMALEIADPVEATWFVLDGIHMSNFVYPSYFEPWHDGQLDFLKTLKTPGQILPGGYQIFRDKETWTTVTGEQQNYDNICYRVRRLMPLAYARLIEH